MHNSSNRFPPVSYSSPSHALFQNIQNDYLKEILKPLSLVIYRWRFSTVNQDMNTHFYTSCDVTFFLHLDCTGSFV